MRFFRRSTPKTEDQPAPQPSRPVDPRPSGPLASISLNPASVAEAKLTIKELQIRKKELQADKRELAAQMSDQREAWRERTAGRYSTVGLGRGTGARIIRGGIQGKRRGERMQHADVINQITNAKQEIDVQIAQVDRAILDLQRFVLRGE